MMRVFLLIFTVNLFFVFGCIQKQDRSALTSLGRVSGQFNIQNVLVNNNQLIIRGGNLARVKSIAIKNDNQTINESLAIESQSDSQIIANGIRNMNFLSDTLLNLVLSSADAASVYTINFSVSNGSITAAMLTSMGATKGQVMKYNGSTWVPSSLTNAQTYLGTWNANTNFPDLTNPSSSPGDYYIVAVAGTFNSVSYAVGDWIISDGYNWDKVGNSSVVVSSFNGRRGLVTLTPADYVSLIDTTSQKITGSSLNDIANVDLTTTAPVANQVLKYNGSKWVPGTATLTESDPTVMAFAKTPLPTCTAGTVLKSDGVSLTCVTDLTGIFTGTKDRVVLTDSTSGLLTTSIVTKSEVEYLSGASSNIQTQINAKLDASRFIDWSSVGIAPTIDPSRINITTSNVNEGTNLYFTNTRAQNALASTLTNYATTTSLATTNANVTAVTNSDALKLPLSGGTITGNLTLNSQVFLKDSGTNYLTVSAPLTVTPYTLTLPSNKGTSGYVLSTDGNGVTSWLNLATSYLAPTGNGSGLTGITASQISGTLPISNGGTGANLTSTAHAGAIPYFSTTTSMSVTAVGSAGNYLKSGGTAAPTWGNFATDIFNSVLGLFVLDTGTKPGITTSDSVGSAFGKVQKHLNDIDSDYLSKSATNQTLTGSVNFTSLTSVLNVLTPSGINLNEVTNVDYVTNAINSSIVWNKSSPNISYSAGNVGIGNSSPVAKLDVTGQIHTNVVNAGTVTTIDWNNGNNQYIGISTCTNITLNNILDGGSYTLAVQGVTSGTCTFTTSNAALNFYFSPANTAVMSDAIYSFIRMGNKVYVSWVTGFQ